MRLREVIVFILLAISSSSPAPAAPQQKSSDTTARAEPTMMQLEARFERTLPPLFRQGPTELGGVEPLEGEESLLLAHPALRDLLLRDFVIRPPRLAALSAPVQEPLSPLGVLPKMTALEWISLKAKRFRELFTDPYVNRLMLETGFTRRAQKTK